MGCAAFSEAPFGRFFRVLASIPFLFTVSFAGTAFADNWSGTGSPAQGGLIRGLVADGAAPGVLYAAVYGNGIFKSTDGGATWGPVNNGLATKRVMSLAAQPDTAFGTLLAGTEGGGIFRSVDGGATWAPSNTGLGCRFVRALRHVPGSPTPYNGSDGPQTPNYVYAGTQCDVNSGIYKSRDGGLTWTQLALPVPNTVVRSVDIRADGASVRLATVNGAFRSSDGGTTWGEINGTSPNMLTGPNGPVLFDHTFSAGFVLASVEGGGIYRSSDQGLNWFPANSGLPVAAGFLAPLVTGGISVASGTAYVSVPGYGVYQSTDQGAIWSALGNTATQLPFVRFLVQDPVTAGTFYAATFAGIHKSVDGGQNWTNISSGLGGGFAHQVATDPNNPSNVLAAAGTIYRSVNGGATWVRSDAGLASPPVSIAYVRGTPGVVLAGTMDGGVFRSSDGGATWVPSNAGLAVVAGRDAQVIPHPVNATRMHVALHGGGVYISSTNGSAPWSGNNSGTPQSVLSFLVDPVTTGTRYISSLDGVYKTTSIAGPWILKLPFSMGNRGGNIAIDRENPATLFVAVFSPDANGAPGPQSGVWKSTNGGETWSMMRAGLAMAVAVVRDATDMAVYAAFWDEGTGGVYKSLDGGTTWTAVNSGLGSDYVRSFETGYLGRSLARAATFGNGIVAYVDDSAGALASMNALLSDLATTVNTNSATLTDAMFAPYFDPQFKHEGRDAAYWTAAFAYYLRGGSISGGGVDRIISYFTDAAGNSTAHTAGSVTYTAQGQTLTDIWNELQTNFFSYFNKPAAGNWTLFGDQQPARLEVNTVTENRQHGITCPTGCDGVYYQTSFWADAPQGTVTGVTVNGQGFSSVPLSSQGTSTEQLWNTPTTTVTYVSDRFGYYPPNGLPPMPAFPAVGVPYVFTVTTTPGPVVQQYVKYVKPWTTETISLTSPTSHALSAANLGNPLTISWTLPTTFTARSVGIWVNTNSSAGGCYNIVEMWDLPPTTTSQTLTIPATCNGQPVVDNATSMVPVVVTVRVDGMNGEQTEVQYGFGQPGNDTTPPSTPTGVVATAISSTQVNLNWTASTDNLGVAGYEVWRNGVFSATVPGAGHVDASVVAETTYTYTVRAYDVAGNYSGQSTVAVVTTPAAAGTVTPYVSDANTVLLDHFDGATSASILAFRELGAACGSPKPAATPNYSFVTGPVGLSQALSLIPPVSEPAGSGTYLWYPGGELLSMPNGTIEFWIYLPSYGSGVTLVQQGPFLGSCAGWTFGMGVTASGQLQSSAWNAFSMDSGAASVPLNTWTHVAATWGSSGARLYINGAQVGSNPSTGAPASGYGGSLQINSWANGVVTQVDELRVSSVQRTSFATGLDTTLPGTPTGLTATAVSSSQINLAWTASTDNVGVTIYQVFRAGAQVATVNAPTTSFSNTGLAASTSYSYTVAACDAAGNCSAQSSPASATTQAGAGAPAAPTGLNALALAATQVQVAWNASAGATSYGVYRATSIGGPYGQISTTTSPAYGDTGVSPATTYYYRVSAINSFGESGLSSSVAGVTTPSCPAGDCVAPSAPATTTAIANSPTQVTVSWSASTDTGGSGLASYRLFRRMPGVSGPSALLGVLSAGATGHVDTTAAPNTSYTYFVSACDGAGNCSVGSPGADVTTPAMGGSVRIVGPYATQRGGSSSYQAWYRPQGDAATPFTPVSPSWSYPTGNASIAGNTLTVSSSLAADEVNNLTASYNSITGSENVKLQANADHWVPASPAPGGDVRALLTLGSGTSQILVAGIYGGGIYRSSDRGASWLPTFGAPNLVRAIRLIPDGSNRILLAATDGDGVYRSVDGGQTWTASNTGLDCRDIRSLAGHANVPASGGIPTTAYAGTHCGLYKSTDAGQTWSKLTSLLVTTPISSLVAAGGETYVHVGTYGEGYFRSTDGGATWQSVSTGLPNGASSKVLSLHRFGPTTGFAILASVEGGGVWKIDELGSNWVDVTGNLPSTRVQSGISSISGSGATSGVYISVDGLGIYKTTNNPANVGSSWSQWVSFASEPRLKRSLGGWLHLDSLGYLYQPTGAGVYRSSDNGLTWQAVNNGLPGGMVLSTFHDPANASTVLAVSDRVYKSTDGGTSWAASDAGVDVTTGHTGIAGASGVITGNSAAVFVSTPNGGVYRSANSGASWSPANSGLPAVIGEAPVIRWHPTNNNIIYLGYPNSARGAYQWNDALGSWTNISGNLSGNALYVGPVIVDSVGGALFAGTRAGLYRSNDNGASWTQLFPIASGRVNQVRVDTMATPRMVYWTVRDENDLAEPTATAGLYRMPVDGVFGSQAQLLSGAHVRNFRIVNPGPPTVYAALWNRYDYGGPLDGVVRGFEGIDGVWQWRELDAGLSAPQIYAFEEAGDGKHVARASSVGGGVYNFAGDITAPSSPGTPTLTSATANQITFSWTAASDDSGAFRYYVRRDGAFLPAGAGLTGLSFVDTGLAASTTYSYQLIACDGSWNCSASSAATLTTTSGTSFTPVLERNWNLLGNALNITLDVATVFGGNTNIASVWKWDASTQTWAYYSPALTAEQLIAFTTSRAYQVLTSIGPGEGYWVNALNAITLPVQTGTVFYYNLVSFAALPPSWNLIATADAYSPHIFSNAMIDAPPPTGGVNDSFFSLWAWDAVRQNWYYYSPALENTGSPKCGLPCVKSYTDARGLLHFEDYGKTLGLGVGFWVNRR